MTDLTKSALLELAAPLRSANAADVVAQFLASRTRASTRDAYRRDLVYFARFANVIPPAAAEVNLRKLKGVAFERARDAKLAAETAMIDAVTGVFLSLDGGQANRVADAWLIAMRDAELSNALISRRLGTLSSLASYARKSGVIDWTLRTQRIERAPTREVRGPDRSEALRLLRHVAEKDSSLVDLRNAVIVTTLLLTGIRRDELHQLDIGDVDVAQRRLRFRGKGRTAKGWHPMGPETASLWERFLRVHPAGEQTRVAPAIPSLGGGHAGKRLSPSRIYAIVSECAADAGLPDVHPHALRHSFSTIALDANDGDMRAVSAATRHRSVETLIRHYDDTRAQQARMVVESVERLLTEKAS